MAASKTDVDRLQSGFDGKVWVEYRDEIAIIRLECGENRMNEHFLDKLNRSLDEIIENPDVKALITTGSGKFFSNGLDLNWLKELSGVSADDVGKFLRKWHQTIRRLLAFPLPTVAAINGHAFAGGAFLSLAHDYRVMSTGRGWWSINEVHLGLQIPLWLVKVLTTKITGSKAQADVLVFGKRLTAEEALDLGVIHRTASSSALLEEAITMAKEVYKRVPPLNRDMVKLIKEDMFHDIIELQEQSIVGQGSNIKAISKL